MKPLTKTITYFLCPNCSKYEFTLNHLDRKMDLCWNCSTCGKSTSFSYDPTIPEIIIKQIEEFPIPSLYLLELKPEDFQESLKLVIKGGTYKNTDISNSQYYYEQHTCPINIINQTVKIIYGQDDDYHGIFKVIGKLTDINCWNSDFIDKLFIKENNNNLLINKE